ncbi:MAG: peptidoglycan DD-metalloendopeptidase family protein [Myxococcota bacterium]|nr:peptidoglycan DD-metalloendopeptidase family protein [Myxococcota bacterium]
MISDVLLRGLAILAMILPAALTTANVVSSPSAADFPLRSALDSAESYVDPHPSIPFPTGILSETSSLSADEAWVALRSPTGEGRPDEARGRRAYRRGRWKGKQTRGRPLSDLVLMIDQYGVTDWVYPMSDDMVAGSPFGRRVHPISGEVKGHAGQDFPCRVGTPIYAVADGKVRYSKNSKSAGRYVEIVHGTWGGKKVKTRYLHMSKRMVHKGDTVRMGQRIGSCGSTGSSTSPHLHFGLWLDDRPRRPFGLSPGLLEREEAEKRSWDEAIAQAIERGTLEELLQGVSVPREVRKVISQYKRRKGKRPPRKLARIVETADEDIAAQHYEDELDREDGERVEAEAEEPSFEAEVVDDTPVPESGTDEVDDSAVLEDGDDAPSAPSSSEMEEPEQTASEEELPDDSTADTADEERPAAEESEEVEPAVEQRPEEADEDEESDLSDSGDDDTADEAIVGPDDPSQGIQAR